MVAGEKENQLIVVGEKGRSQLQRDMRDSIVATVADTNKVRITFPQVGHHAGKQQRVVA